MKIIKKSKAIKPMRSFGLVETPTKEEVKAETTPVDTDLPEVNHGNVMDHLASLTRAELENLLLAIKFIEEPGHFYAFINGMRDENNQLSNAEIDNLFSISEELKGLNAEAVQALLADKPALKESYDLREKMFDLVTKGILEAETVPLFESYLLDYKINETAAVTSPTEEAVTETTTEVQEGKTEDTPVTEEAKPDLPAPEVENKAVVEETPPTPPAKAEETTTAVGLPVDLQGVSMEELKGAVSMAKGIRTVSKVAPGLGLEIALNAIKGVQESEAIQNSEK